MCDVGKWNGTRPIFFDYWLAVVSLKIFSCHFFFGGGFRFIVGIIVAQQQGRAESIIKGYSTQISEAAAKHET